MRNLRSLGLSALAGLMFVSLSACSGMDMPNLPTMTQFDAASFDTSQLGGRLAQTASLSASGGTGYCYQYVAQAIHAQLPAFLYGQHAYMAADQLAASSFFREVAVSPDTLPNLPAGAIVVWGQGSSESGHISIADGHGNEISDHISRQMTAHYGGASARVFLPASTL